MVGRCLKCSMPAPSERPWVIRAPVVTMAWTQPRSIISHSSRPCLAIVIAPEMVTTRKQSASRTIASSTSAAFAQAPPAEGGLCSWRGRGRRRCRFREGRGGVSGLEPVFVPRAVEALVAGFGHGMSSGVAVRVAPPASRGASRRFGLVRGKRAAPAPADVGGGAAVDRASRPGEPARRDARRRFGAPGAATSTASSGSSTSRRARSRPGRRCGDRRSGIADDHGHREFLARARGPRGRGWGRRVGRARGRRRGCRSRDRRSRCRSSRPARFASAQEAEDGEPGGVGRGAVVVRARALGEGLAVARRQEEVALGFVVEARGDVAGEARATSKKRSPAPARWRSSAGLEHARRGRRGRPGRGRALVPDAEQPPLARRPSARARSPRRDRVARGGSSPSRLPARARPEIASPFHAATRLRSVSGAMRAGAAPRRAARAPRASSRAAARQVAGGSCRARSCPRSDTP